MENLQSLHTYYISSMRKFLVVIIFFLFSCASTESTFKTCGRIYGAACSQDQIKEWENKLSTEYEIFKILLKYKGKVSVSLGETYWPASVFDSDNSNPDSLNKEEFINLAKSTAKNYNNLVEFNMTMGNLSLMIDRNFSDVLREFNSMYDRYVDDGNGGKIYIWESMDTSSTTITTGGSSTTYPMKFGDYTYYLRKKDKQITTSYVTKTNLNIFTDKDNYIYQINFFSKTY